MDGTLLCMKRWSIVFKALNNINRLKIVVLLTKRGELHVSDIADELKIAQKSVSKHLIQLQRLDVLNSFGRNNHVYYSLNPGMPEDFKRTIKLLGLPPV